MQGVRRELTAEEQLARDARRTAIGAGATSKGEQLRQLFAACAGKEAAGAGAGLWKAFHHAVSPWLEYPGEPQHAAAEVRRAPSEATVGRLAGAIRTYALCFVDERSRLEDADRHATAALAARVRSNSRVYYSFEEATEHLRRLKLGSYAELRSYLDSPTRNERLPSRPWDAYGARFSAQAACGYTPSAASAGLRSPYELTQAALQEHDVFARGVCNRSTYVDNHGWLAQRFPELTWPENPQLCYKRCGAWVGWPEWTGHTEAEEKKATKRAYDTTAGSSSSGRAPRATPGCGECAGCSARARCLGEGEGVG
jgi:hypothetical protein